jgi:hypothetical protein
VEAPAWGGELRMEAPSWAWGGEPHVEMPVRGDAWRHQLVAARGGAGVGRQAARGGAGMERRTDGALDSRALFIFLTRAQFP